MKIYGGFDYEKIKSFYINCNDNIHVRNFGNKTAYETYIPVSIRYEKTDSNGDGVEDSITILYDKTYVTAESVIIPDKIDGMPVTEIYRMYFSKVR